MKKSCYLYKVKSISYKAYWHINLIYKPLKHLICSTHLEIFSVLPVLGESHGKGVGGVIDGFPAGIVIDMDFVQAELDRRRPGQSRITTARKEGDKVEFLSGIFEGKSTGCPIGFIVWNQNQHSDDYNNLKEVYRPSHADYTYKVNNGIRDHRRRRTFISP